MRRFWIFGFLLLLAGCHVEGCQRKIKPTYLRVHIESEPKTLDPALATGVREFQILQAIFEGLTRYHPQTLKVLPGVAEKWNLSEEGTLYTFVLRSDAKWSDGRSVTAQDFWNGWERLLSPMTQSPYASQLFDMEGAEEYAAGALKDPAKIGMKVKSTRIFEVKLKQPTPYFLSLTSFAALAPIRKDAGDRPFLKTNGPFKLAENGTPGEGILLLPNEYYWGRHDIRLKGIQFRPFGDFNTALKMYGRTGIDLLTDLPPTQVPVLKFRSDFHNAPLLRTEYFVINCRKPPFNDPRVRQALALAIDRPAITDEVLKRGDIPYGLFVPPGLPNYQNASNPQAFDPEKGRRLLKEAGFGEKNPFPVLHVHYNEATDRKLVAQAAAAMWEKNLGLRTHLVEDQWADFLTKRQKRDYEISWGGWYGDYLDPKTFLDLFTTTHRQNHAGWSHPAYDALVRKAQGEQDSKLRMKYFQEAESILLREAAIIPVLVKAKTYLIQPYVKEYFPNLLDIHILRDVWSERP